MRYEDSMKGVADQIIKEQQRASKIKNNPEEFHWYDEYATLNFFRFICKNIGNLGNGEIEKMPKQHHSHGFPLLSDLCSLSV